MSFFSGLQSAFSTILSVSRAAAPVLSFTYGHFYDKQIIQQLASFPIDENEMFAFESISDVEHALKYCHDIYIQKFSYLPEYEVLSTGFDLFPDCIAFFRSEDQSNEPFGTLWVVIRGTNTLLDLVTNISWIVSLKKMEHELEPGDNFDLPIGIAINATKLFNGLIAYLDRFLKNHPDKKIRRVCIAGHSLGGAYATALHILYSRHRQRQQQLGSIVFPGSVVYTIDAPLCIHIFPSNTPPTLSSFPSFRCSEHVHNIVYQLDPVSRLLGRHDLPTYLQETDFFRYYENFLSIVDRKNYVPFGRFYLLRSKRVTKAILNTQHSEASANGNINADQLNGNASGSSSSGIPYNEEELSTSLCLTSIPHATSNYDVVSTLLSLFPSNAIDFSFSIINDHCIDTSFFPPDLP